MRNLVRSEWALVLTLAGLLALLLRSGGSPGYPPPENYQYPFGWVTVAAGLMFLETALLAAILRPRTYNRSWRRAVLAVLVFVPLSWFFLLGTMHMPGFVIAHSVGLLALAAIAVGTLTVTLLALPIARPSAELRDPKAGPRSSIVAVLLGGLGVDFIGTRAVGIVMGIVGAVVISATGGDTEAWRESALYVALSHLLDAAMTLAGGFVAATWARNRPLLHSLAAGGLSLALVFVLGTGRPDPLWLAILGLVLHLPLAASGGYLASRPAV